jgi:hypothetical protein
VPFATPSLPGAGQPVDATTSAMLNWLVKNGALPTGKRVGAAQLLSLYRARQIPVSATTVLPLAGDPQPFLRKPCDPEDPGPPPAPGFSCQPTGKWEGAENPDAALQDRIENAYKGDAVLVRGCGGMVGPLLGALHPAQLYTHTGIMTKHRAEIAQSTGSEGWLSETQANGLGGQPTDGFQEHGLRYLWPGTVVAPVREAFVTGHTAPTPEGAYASVTGFARSEVRCPGDAQIVYPRVLKPAPEFEMATRPQLMRAGDEAKKIHGHYRFSTYSKAAATAVADPAGPAALADGAELAYGPTPTVCSAFVRLSLKQAGFELDRDKSFPLPSDVRGAPADGLFFYDASERRAAAERLYAGLYEDVEYALANLTAQTDDHWWYGAAALAAPELAPLGPLVTIGSMTSGTLVKWATDAPEKVANQVTNCFASDFCSDAAKTSHAWESPGTGVAVSPDDMLNHFDSPATGGPYGYSERMIYRGRTLRPVYEWRPNEGSIPVTVKVTTGDGKPAALAEVTIPGFLTTPVTTDATGHVLIEGVPRGNLLLHAQKFFAAPAPGGMREADVCYVPASTTSKEWLAVDCADFSKVLSLTPVAEVTAVLMPPKADYRKVVISGDVWLKDCDCGSSDETATKKIFQVCHVSPLEPKQVVSFSNKDYCADEVGLSMTATCELLADRRVEVKTHFEFFEDVSDSCGADDKEDQRDYDVTVVSGGTTSPFTGTDRLYNYGVCTFPVVTECNDAAEISNLTFTNSTDD